ncbi:hypothetical protein JD969_08935 [Planctomycetota bacterium]|nr:hypothetical protein JD969_08935 [Planctomycetota bacterium]
MMNKEVKVQPRQWEHSQGKYVETKDGFKLVFRGVDPMGKTTVVLGVGGLLLGLSIGLEVYVVTYETPFVIGMLGVIAGLLGFNLLWMSLFIKFASDVVKVRGQRISFKNYTKNPFWPRRRGCQAGDVEFAINLNSRRNEYYLTLHKGNGWYTKKSKCEIVAVTSDGDQVCFSEWEIEDLRWIIDMLCWKFPDIRSYECVDGKLIEDEFEGAVMNEGKS